MKPVKLLKIAASTMVLAVGMAGAGPGGLATLASASNPSNEAKAGDIAFRKAQRALAKGKLDRAVHEAEAAVAFAPDRTSYRMLLAQAYLESGRLSSAETTFGDVLSLDPSNGRAGLNRALMQIALGRSENALSTLDQYRESMSASDFGLAVALAGDTAGAVRVLEAAVRAPGADVKTRQNLALAYALNRQWALARVMAAVDLSPDLLDDRITEWARFSRPSSAQDQVASMMRIKPVTDSGQPQHLALVRSQPQAAIALPVAPATMPVAQAKQQAPAPQIMAQPTPAFEVAGPAASPVAAPSVAIAPAAPKLTIPLDPPTPAAAPAKQAMAPAKQVVVAAMPAVPVKQAVAAPVAKAIPEAPKFVRAVESGRFVVQLGAYSNEGRAQIGWDRAVGRTQHLTNYPVATARVQVRGASLYRLSVAGFTSREVANQVCTRVKAAGGECFVRSVAGDKPMQWVSRGGTRLASR